MKQIGDGHKDAIISYLVADEGSAPALSDKQKELLQRWEYADELIRQNTMRRETIAQMIMRKFDISRHTAYQDIVNAEDVFSSSTPLNKRYRIQLRIELLEMRINELWNDLQPEPMDEEDLLSRISREKQNRLYILEAAQLEKVLAKYYEMLPNGVPQRSARKIIFNVQVNNSFPAPGNVTDALQAAANFLNIPAKDHGEI